MILEILVCSTHVRYFGNILVIVFLSAGILNYFESSPSVIGSALLRTAGSPLGSPYRGNIDVCYSG